MDFLRKVLRAGLLGLVAAAVLGALALGASYLYIAPKLPSIEALKDIRLQVPMRVYTRDGRLIGEFGQKKRTPLHFYETPGMMVKAVLAAEDDRFFQHPGVDYQGILRAAANLIATGEKSQGGSTITMQVARNFFLTSEKTYLRKLSEIFLALKIEHELSKEEILELYLNKIYLGNRAYGIAAAAYTYYGVSVDQLTLPQMAMIAGLPKAPSRYNPLADAQRALLRRDYVLRRMHELGFIDDETFAQARQTPDDARRHELTIEVEADYLAEMVRAAMVERYGEQAAYTGGFNVYTTLDSRLQIAANTAVWDALHEYDRRHGYRGPEGHLDIKAIQQPEGWWRVFEARRAQIGDLQPALVTWIDERSAGALLADGSAIEIPWEGLAWARRYIDDATVGAKPEQAGDVLAPGDVIRVRRASRHWQLAQLPSVEGALISLRPADAAILALVGGFDFYQSKFNRAVQAARQPGSSFKPFIYSAALEKGFTTATLVNDAPVVFDDPALESAWRPENYGHKFFGPTRLREALINSRNLVSIRVLRAIGIDYAIDYAARFGFQPRELPRNLSLALGSAAITPLQLASGYAVFANGGYRVFPYFIERVTDSNGAVMFQAEPARACPECEETDGTAPAAAPELRPVAGPADPAGPQTPPDAAPRLAKRVITPQNVYLMDSMMHDVIQAGTGRRARQLGRSDLSGKTGTTNDQRDTWFAGFNPDIVTITWVGFDKDRSLGPGETGARTALPMWIDFMREALRGVPEHTLTRPPGLVTVRIDPTTGLLANSGQEDAIFETFRTEEVPQQHADLNPVAGPGTDGAEREVPEELF